jgi:hypothetical protein
MNTSTDLFLKILKQMTSNPTPKTTYGNLGYLLSDVRIPSKLPFFLKT